MHINIAQLPDPSDINDLYQSGNEKQIVEAIKNSTPFFLSAGDSQDSLFSSEKEQHDGPAAAEKAPVKEKNTTTKNQPRLDTKNPLSMLFYGKSTLITIKGGLGKNGFDALRLTLEIKAINKDNDHILKSRQRLDLYDDRQVEKAAAYAAPKLKLSAEAIAEDISAMTDAIDLHREQLRTAREKKNTTTPLTPKAEQKARSILEGKNLLENLNDMIGKSGVVGEEKNRQLLFMIALSHKFKRPLHAIVQAASGSGKTHLIHAITDLMPPEKVKRLTRVSDKSFYNYGEYDLVNTLIVIEDYDGMNEDAEFALRELQSNDELISSVSAKLDGSEQIRSGERKVRGPVATIIATTHGQLYEDNMSRVLLLSIDESDEQTDRIVKRLCDIAAGIIDEEEEQRIQKQVRDIVSLIKPVKVINPHAHRVTLPAYVNDRRRLSAIFEMFITHMTRLHQYQRSTDDKGRYITTTEDIRHAINIMFDAIVLKVDELDGSLRTFYEKLKRYIKSKEQTFTQREIRQKLRISKSQLQRFLKDLVELEYISMTGRQQHRTYTYQINYWDDIEALRKRIKDDLYGQLAELEDEKAS